MHFILGAQRIRGAAGAGLHVQLPAAAAGAHEGHPAALDQGLLLLGRRRRGRRAGARGRHREARGKF